MGPPTVIRQCAGNAVADLAVAPVKCSSYIVFCIASCRVFACSSPSTWPPERRKECLLSGTKASEEFRRPVIEPKEPVKRLNKRRSSTLDRGEQVQVFQTPSLRLNGPKSTPKQTPLKLHGPKPTSKQTPLKLNGLKKTPLKLHFGAFTGTQGSNRDGDISSLFTPTMNDNMPPPPTPPATFSTY